MLSGIQNPFSEIEPILWVTICEQRAVLNDCGNVFRDVSWPKYFAFGGNCSLIFTLFNILALKFQA